MITYSKTPKKCRRPPQKPHCTALWAKHCVKILGLQQKKLHKGFYAKNGVPYICEDDI